MRKQNNLHKPLLNTLINKSENENSYEGKNQEEEEESEEEEEEEEKDEEEPFYKDSDKIQIESESNIENSLVSWPNCARTFFPERLNIHLKSWKSGKPMKSMIKKKPVYQPPKLKIKSAWKPCKSESKEDENNDFEEKKTKIIPKKKKSGAEKLSGHDTYEENKIKSKICK